MGRSGEATMGMGWTRGRGTHRHEVGTRIGGLVKGWASQRSQRRGIPGCRHGKMSRLTVSVTSEELRGVDTERTSAVRTIHF